LARANQGQPDTQEDGRAADFLYREKLTMSELPTLQLVQKRKIADLLPDAPLGVAYEASGVLAKDGKFFVVCDNSTSIARLSQDLSPNPMNGLFGTAPGEDGYEGITYNAAKSRYYLLVESRKQKGGRYGGEIVEYDYTLSYVKKRLLDFKFKTANKGFEAVGHVRRNGQDYVLALCEGNKCKSGRSGRRPGGGRVQLFRKGKRRWSHVGTIKLPKSVQFEDYSAMSIDGTRVAVVSQVTSRLWVGVFEEAAWGWRDNGQIYQFPRTSDNGKLYGNVEGAAWITPNRLVTVSDRRKKDQDERFADTEQSVDIFDLPS
jgi:hypothetical protein